MESLKASYRLRQRRSEICLATASPSIGGHGEWSALGSRDIIQRPTVHAGLHLTPNAEAEARLLEKSTQPVTQHELLADFSLEFGIQAHEQLFAAVAIHCR